MKKYLTSTRLFDIISIARLWIGRYAAGFKADSCHARRKPSVPFETSEDLSDLVFGSCKPADEQVLARGKVRNTAGVLELTGEVSTTLHGVCDRCAAAFTRAITIPVHAVLVPEQELEQAEDEWTFGIHDGCADLTDIVTTAFVLGLDSQLLCRPDCKGICFRCGKNLNEGPCGCKPEVDSRFAVLQQLLDK